MSTLDDIVNKIGTSDYTTIAIVILAVVLLGVIVILAYRIHLNKKNSRRNEPQYFSPQYQEPPAYQEQPPYGYERASIPPQPMPESQRAYPGSVAVIGNYTLFDDRIQISPRKCVFYDEITAVRYESNFTSRVVITIGHAWELSLSADNHTLKLYNEIMTRMNSEIIIQSMGRKKRMISR